MKLDIAPATALGRSTRELRTRLNAAIPSDWLTNAALLVLVAVISYGIFLAIMVGTSGGTSGGANRPDVDKPTPPRPPTVQT